MKIKVIKTEQDYKNAVLQLEELGDHPNFEENQELIDEFDLLEFLVEKYDAENYPLDVGHPIEVIKLKMEYMGIKQKDLSPDIASKGIISEIMNEKRSMSKVVIRKLSGLLNISQEVLNVPYEIKKGVGKKVKSAKASQIVFKFTEKINSKVVRLQDQIRIGGMPVNACL